MKRNRKKSESLVMDLGFISYIAIGVGIAMIIIGLLVKKFTKRKVDDLDGFVGILDESEGRKDG